VTSTCAHPIRYRYTHHTRSQGLNRLDLICTKRRSLKQLEASPPAVPKAAAAGPAAAAPVARKVPALSPRLPAAVSPSPAMRAAKNTLSPAPAAAAAASSPTTQLPRRPVKQPPPNNTIVPTAATAPPTAPPKAAVLAPTSQPAAAGSPKPGPWPTPAAATASASPPPPTMGAAPGDDDAKSIPTTSPRDLPVAEFANMTANNCANCWICSKCYACIGAFLMPACRKNRGTEACLECKKCESKCPPPCECHGHVGWGCLKLGWLDTLQPLT